jgi:anti-sigma factor RsiW
VTCDELRELLHGYVDGELDLIHNLQVEQHLGDCPTCTAALRDLRSLRQTVGAAELYHRAPARLQERIQASLQPTRPSQTIGRLQVWRLLAVAASVGLLALVAYGALWWRSSPAAEDRVAQEVFSSHMRSLLAVRGPVDKPSSNRHKVKPWFSGKVDFAPIVKDLEREGFPLVGGRLDYLANRKVAALVYMRHLHVINVFQWPARGMADRDPQLLTYQNYQLVHWTRAGTTFWAISDLNAEELQEFARLFS